MLDFDVRNRSVNFAETIAVQTNRKEYSNLHKFRSKSAFRAHLLPRGASRTGGQNPPPCATPARRSVICYSVYSRFYSIRSIPFHSVRFYFSGPATIFGPGCIFCPSRPATQLPRLLFQELCGGFGRGCSFFALFQ